VRSLWRGVQSGLLDNLIDMRGADDLFLGDTVETRVRWCSVSIDHWRHIFSHISVSCVYVFMRGGYQLQKGKLALCWAGELDDGVQREKRSRPTK